MLACNRLRIDMGDGSPAVDYRIEGDRVECRILENAPNSALERAWRQLTPEQLTSHVSGETVISVWLRRRMGIFRLLRACSQPVTTSSAQAERAAA